MLRPGAWLPTLRGVSASMRGAVRRRDKPAPAAPNGGSLGLSTAGRPTTSGRSTSC